MTPQLAGWGMEIRRAIREGRPGSMQLLGAVVDWQAVAEAWREEDAAIRAVLLSRLRDLPQGRLEVGERVWYGERLKKVGRVHPHRAFAVCALRLREELTAPQELVGDEAMAYELEELSRRVLSTQALKPAAARAVLGPHADRYLPITWADRLADGTLPLKLRASERRFLERGR